MRNKEPWKPIKPKHTIKCKTCSGIGKVTTHVFTYWSSKTETYNCNNCGGKGYK